jgi:hypothetical protein
MGWAMRFWGIGDDGDGLTDLLGEAFDKEFLAIGRQISIHGGKINGQRILNEEQWSSLGIEQHFVWFC